MTVPQEPLPPAVAYPVIADLLGEDYFLHEPPRQGALLQVVGSDGIVTQWAMAVQQAQRLMEPLRRDNRIARVIPSRYEGTQVA